MMITVASTAGMCSGVARALKIAEITQKNKNGNIYVYGNLVNNDQVIERLKDSGIICINNDDNYDYYADKTVIIRSHGIAPASEAALKVISSELIDATCPFVKRAQLKAHWFSENDYFLVIVGELEHPEVKGLLGWSNGKGVVICCPSDVDNIRTEKKIGVISQTTQNRANVNNILARLKEMFPHVEYADTLCTETLRRQTSAVEVAQNSDIMIVVGGSHSSNTKQLADKCRDFCMDVYHIETYNDLQTAWFRDKINIGITAGASTPDWIIEEVILKMEELLHLEKENLDEEKSTAVESVEKVQADDNEDNQDYLTSLYDSFKDHSSGDYVKGIIMQISEDSVLVDIGYKSEGKIAAKEFESIDTLKVGDEIDVYIVTTESRDGEVILSKRKADMEKRWVDIEKAYEEKLPLAAVVSEKVKGGLLVNIGVKAFLPASLVDRKYVSDLDSFLGTTVMVEIIEMNRKRNKVVVSAKEIAKKAYDELRENVWSKLEEGTICKGTVKRIVDFGAFIDLAGIEGLLHISELSWKRVKHPSDVLTEGQEVEVKILSVDKEKERISLSCKQVKEHPWINIKEKYNVGDVVEGKVVSIMPFGVFVSLEEGVEGLVHISQLADKFVSKASEIVAIGDQVTAKILDIDVEKKRISLSIRATLPEAEPVVEEKAELPASEEPADAKENE